MGACFGSNAPPVHAEIIDVRAEREISVKIREKAAIEAMRLLGFIDSLKSSKPYYDGINLLTLKENSDLCRELGMWIPSSTSITHGVTDANIEFAVTNDSNTRDFGLCSFPGGELKYGCNKPEVDSYYKDEASALNAYKHVTVDREGHLYFSVLGTHWSKFNLYSRGFPSTGRCPSSPSLGSHLAGLIARGYTAESAPSRYLKSYLSVNAEVWSDSHRCVCPVPADLLALCTGGNSEGDYQLRDYCDHVVGESGDKEEEKTTDDQLQHRRGDMFFAMCDRHWDIIKRDNNLLNVASVINDASSSDLVSNAGNMRRFLATLRPGAAAEPAAFMQIYTSSECESIYMRKPKRLDYWFQHLLDTGNHANEAEMHVADDNDLPSYTGAHIMSKVGAPRIPRPSSALPPKVRRTNGYEWHYGPEYDRKFEDEVQVLYPVELSTEENIAAKIEEEVKNMSKGRKTDKDKDKIQDSQPKTMSLLKSAVPPSAYEAQQLHLARLRLLVRRSVKRNHKKFSRIDSSKQLQSDQKIACASEHALSSSISNLHVNGSLLNEPRSALQQKSDQCFELYAHLKFFLYNQNESQKQLHALCQRIEDEEAITEKKRVQDEKRRVEREEKEEKRRTKEEAQALIDERIATNYGSKPGTLKAHSQTGTPHAGSPHAGSPHAGTPPSIAKVSLSLAEDENESENGDILGELRNALTPATGTTPLTPLARDVGSGDIASRATTASRSGTDVNIEFSSYRDMLSALSPADIGNTTFGSGSTWEPLQQLISVALERTNGGSHDKKSSNAATIGDEQDTEVLKKAETEINAAKITQAQRITWINVCKRKFKYVLSRLTKRRASTRSVQENQNHFASFAEQSREELLLPLASNVVESATPATEPLVPRHYSALLDNDILFKLIAQVFRQVCESAHELKSVILSHTRVIRLRGANSAEEVIDTEKVAGLPSTIGGVFTRVSSRHKTAAPALHPTFTALQAVQYCFNAQLSGVRVSFAHELQGRQNSAAPMLLQALVNSEKVQKDNQPSVPSLPSLQTSHAIFGVRVVTGSGIGVVVDAVGLTIPSFMQSNYDWDKSWRCRSGVKTRIRKRITLDLPALVPVPVPIPVSVPVLAQLLSKGRGRADRCWSVVSPTLSSSDKAGSSYLHEMCPRMILRKRLATVASATAQQVLSLAQIVQLVFTRTEFAPFVRDTRLHGFTVFNRDSVPVAAATTTSADVSSSGGTARNSRGDCSGIFVSLLVTLNFGDSAGFGPTRRASATLRLLSRDKSDKTASAIPLGDAPADITLERTIVLDNWRELRSVLLSRGYFADTTERTAITLEFAVPKAPCA